MPDRQQIVEQAWEARATITPAGASSAVKHAVESVISDLDSGTLRVAEKINEQWTTHQWLKKAVLLSFRLSDNGVIAANDESPGSAAYPRYYDKVREQVCRLGSQPVCHRGFPGRALRRRAARRVPGEERHSDAILCQHRRVRR